MSIFLGGKNITPLVAVTIKDLKGKNITDYYQQCPYCKEPVTHGLELEGTAFCDEECLKNLGVSEEVIKELWGQYDDFDTCPLFYTDWVGYYSEQDYYDSLKTKY